MTAGLADLGQNLRTVVIGASGGIGGALVDCLARCAAVESVLACSRSAITVPSPKVTSMMLSLDDEASIEAAAGAAGDAPLHLVIVATGVLHTAGMQPEKSWRQLDADSLLKSLSINTVGPALIAKHFLPRLDRNRPAVFAALSARVGSISDNRLGGWYGYRASKAALNMLLQSLAIELARRAPQALCIGLHPGTVDTALSKPFQRGVTEDSLFTPQRAAAQLLRVIAARGPADSGGVFAWDGSRIPA